MGTVGPGKGLGFFLIAIGDCSHFLGFPGGSAVKNLPANAGDLGSILWVGKIPWRRKWQPTPVFLPGKSHGQRSLAAYSVQG